MFLPAGGKAEVLASKTLRKEFAVIVKRLQALYHRNRTDQAA